VPMKGIRRLRAEVLTLPDSQPEQWRPVRKQQPGMQLRQLGKLLSLGLPDIQIRCRFPGEIL
jgi:hypothetical protein